MILRVVFSKKLVGRIVLALLLAAVVGACAMVAASDQTGIRVTYNPIPLNIPTILMQKGILQDRLDPLGVEVQWVSGLLKGSLMTEHMAAGSLDVASVMGGTSALISFAGGRDIRIVGGYSKAPSGFGIVVRPDSPIQKVADLRGKTVVGPVGTEVHYLLAKALEECGLGLEDVILKNDMVPNAVSHVINGSADAALVVEPTMSIHESQGKVRVLRTGKGLMPGATFVAVRGEFLRDHPDVVKEYLKAQAMAIRSMESMGREALVLAASELGMPLQVIESVSRKYEFDVSLDSQAVSDLEDLARFLADAGLVRSSINIDSLVDTTLLEAALSELEAGIQQ